MRRLDPDILLKAYATGIFPMADSRDADEVYWVEPKKRGIIPLEGFHMSRSLARLVRSDHFAVTADHCFAEVVRQCATSAPGREETWINAHIEDAYQSLHARGYAHSVECWYEDQLVGGLYGVSLGRAFFGESMFSRMPNASKVAMCHLIARLRYGGFQLLDCQFITPHLQSLGAIEVPQRHYLGLLGDALADGYSADFSALSPDASDLRRVEEDVPELARTVSGPVSGYRISQLLGQTS